MTIAIYYDLDQISPADIARARAGRGNYREAMPAGSIWPDGQGPAPLIVPDKRSPEYHNSFMPWIDRLLAHLEISAPEAIFRRGVSLAEVARFHFLFTAREGEQRHQALGRVCREFAPSRVLWVAAASAKNVELLSSNALNLPVEILRDRLSPTEWSRRNLSAVKDRLAPAWHRTRKALAAIGRANTTLPAAGGLLFTEYFPNSVHASLPVARVLTEQFGERCSWLAARDEVASTLQREGESPLLVDAMMSAAAHLDSRLTARQRRAIISSFGTLPDGFWRGTSDYANRTYLQAILRQYLLPAIDLAAYWVDAYWTSLEKIRPRAIVTTTYSSVVGRAAALCGRRMGTPCIYLQHGLFPNLEFYYRFCNDLILFWGEFDRRNAVGYGVDESDIRVVGATPYAKFAQRVAAGDSRPFPAAHSPLVVAYLPTRTKSAPEASKALAAVAAATGRIEGAKLIVKPHPGDQRQMFFEEILSQHAHGQLLRQAKAQELIFDSDAVIVVESTTGMEACLAHRPLITLNTSAVASYVPYAEYGAAIDILATGSDASELIEAALLSLHNPQIRERLADGRRRLLDDMLAGGGDGAVLRAAEIIAKFTALDAHVARPVGASAQGI